MNHDQKRREFLKNAFQVVGLAAAAPVVMKAFSSTAFAEERRRGGATPAATPAGGATGDLALPLVKVGEGMAAGVNYVEDTAQVKKAELKIERSGVKFADQHCANCGFYSKVGTKDGKEVGKCTIFSGQLVHAKAWCSTWNKKQG